MLRLLSLVFYVFVLALVALVFVAPVSACDYGVASAGVPAFSLVQQPVYAQQFVAQPVVVGGYGQAFVQRQRVVVPQAVVVRQRVVVRQPLVRVRAPFVAVGY